MYDFGDLQSQDDVRREFIANLSHELKTPIFNIQSYILTLLDGVDDENTKNEYLKKANRNVRRMIRLVRDMDVLAHLESSKLVLNKEGYNLTEQIDDILEQVSDRIHDLDIKVIQDYDTSITRIAFADPERMEQVFLNLVSNAVKYSKTDFKGRLIKFKIEEFDNFFLISIEDNGIGIAKNDIQRIFERFFRADRSRSVKGKLGSSGLGLAIAKHIIEAHGMVIRVTSNLGIGTMFSITIAKP
jgi:two-component system phosphate regulon sensor histidine kinase PhoR